MQNTVKSPLYSPGSQTFCLIHHPRALRAVKIKLKSQAAQALYQPHKELNMASNYKGLYRIFYKISMEVVKSASSPCYPVYFSGYEDLSTIYTT